MLRGAELYLSADVDGDGQLEEGRFVLTQQSIDIAPTIRTGYLIGPVGSSVGAIVDTFSGQESGRAGWRLDAGGGAFAIEVSFRRGFDGPDGQWGDGSGDPQADATGEGVFRAMSVLMRYLNRGTYDSRGGSEAILHWGEYEPDGVYNPIKVAPEEPRVQFTAEDQSSVFDGSLTLVATRSITQAAVSQQQDQR